MRDNKDNLLLEYYSTTTVTAGYSMECNIFMYNQIYSNFLGWGS